MLRAGGVLLDRPIRTADDPPAQGGRLLAIEQPCAPPSDWPAFETLFEEPPGDASGRWPELGRAEPPDRLTEVRWIGGWIARASARGTPLSRIAVASSDPALYGPIFGEVFPLYGLPFQLLPGMPLLETRAARLVLSLLALPERGYPLPLLLRLPIDLGLPESVRRGPGWTEPDRWRALLKSLGSAPALRQDDDLASLLEQDLGADKRALSALLELDGPRPATRLRRVIEALGLARLFARSPALYQVIALAEAHPDHDAAQLRSLLASHVCQTGQPATGAVRVIGLDQLTQLVGAELVCICGLTEGVARPPLDRIAARRIVLSTPAADGDRELRPARWLPKARPWLPAAALAPGPRLGAYAAAQRRGLRPTAYDGDLSSIAFMLGTPVLSATRLEQYAHCPFRFFVDSTLKIRQPEALSREVSPVDIGLLTHRLLFELSLFLREQSGQSLASLAESERARIRAEASELIDALLDGMFDGLSGYPPVFRARARRELRGVLCQFIDAELSELSRLAPAYFELGFGRPNNEGDQASAEPIEVPGTGVRFAGSIDRVELSRLGGVLQVMVYDYKTGLVPSTSSILGGVGFQLPLYLMLVEQLLRLRGESFEMLSLLGGRYYQVAAADRFGRRGGIYDHEGLEAQGAPVRTELGSLTGAALDELIEQYRDEVIQAARGISGGQFSTGLLRPRWMGCSRCPYQGACRVDPALNARRALAQEGR